MAQCDIQRNTRETKWESEEKSPLWSKQGLINRLYEVLCYNSTAMNTSQHEDDKTGNNDSSLTDTAQQHCSEHILVQCVTTFSSLQIFLG